MTATKTNERPGTRAQHRHAHVSAYKAREVLDLIRGKDLTEAYDILEFSERDVAQVVLKVLDSAVANAENNDGIASDELFVTACYADEGPTLKRWRPRARGRATRIRKRTCHITVIVARLSADQLEEREARQEARAERGAGSAADARRRRVEKSKAKAEAREAAEADHDHDDEEDAGEVAEPTAATADAAADAAADADDAAASEDEAASADNETEEAGSDESDASDEPVDAEESEDSEKSEADGEDD